MPSAVVPPDGAAGDGVVALTAHPASTQGLRGPCAAPTGSSVGLSGSGWFHVRAPRAIPSMTAWAETTVAVARESVLLVLGARTRHPGPLAVRAVSSAAPPPPPSRGIGGCARGVRDRPVSRQRHGPAPESHGVGILALGPPRQGERRVRWPRGRAEAALPRDGDGQRGAVSASSGSRATASSDSATAPNSLHRLWRKPNARGPRGSFALPGLPSVQPWAGLTRTSGRGLSRRVEVRSYTGKKCPQRALRQLNALDPAKAPQVRRHLPWPTVTGTGQTLRSLSRSPFNRFIGVGGESFGGRRLHIRPETVTLGTWQVSGGRMAGTRASGGRTRVGAMGIQAMWVTSTAGRSAWASRFGAERTGRQLHDSYVPIPGQKAAAHHCDHGGRAAIARIIDELRDAAREHCARCTPPR
jgi:hypothetical protein